MRIDSEVIAKYTYRKFKLKNNVSILKKKFGRVSYTKHVSYYRKEQNKKTLNYLLNSMPSYFDWDIEI